MNAAKPGKSSIICRDHELDFTVCNLNFKVLISNGCKSNSMVPFFTRRTRSESSRRLASLAALIFAFDLILTPVVA